MITRLPYTLGLPTDSDTFVLFDSTVSAGQKLNGAGVRRYAYSIAHDQPGTVKGYWSNDGGTTWTEFYSGAWGAPGSTEVHSGDVYIAKYLDVRFVWVNGGTTQTTFIVNHVLSTQRTPAAISGVGTPQEIFGDTLELMLESDKGVLLNSGAVETWYDQSGKGRNFSQGTAGSRPTYNASDSNWGGRPSLTFDGTDDYLQSDDAASVWRFLHDGTGGCVVAVLHHRGQPAQQRIWTTRSSGSSVGAMGRIRPNTNVASMVAGNGTMTLVSVDGEALDPSANVYALWAYEDGRGGNEVLVRTNGSDVTGNDSGGTPDAGDPSVTMDIGGLNDGDPVDGEILAVYAFSVYPTAAQLSAFKEYLNYKFMDDPATILGADLELWLDADPRYVTLVGGKVSQWRCRVTGKTFSQGTASARPTYNTSDSNWGGRPSLTFDPSGSVQRLVTDSPTDTWNFLHDGTGMFFVAVHRTTNVSAERRIFSTGWGSARSFTIRHVTGPNVSALIGGVSASIVTAAGSASVGANHWSALAWEDGRAGNEYDLSVDGSSLASGNSSDVPDAADAFGAATIGASHAGTIGYYGEILAVYAFSAYPSAAQITRLGQYISWTLPV